MDMKHLDKTKELIGNNEKRISLDPVKIKSDEIKNKEELNKRLQQVKDDLKRIERRLVNLGEDKTLKEAINVYLAYEEELDKSWQQIKCIKDIIENAKTDKCSIELDLKPKEANVQSLIGHLRDKKQKEDDIQKLKGRLESLQETSKRPIQWSGKLQYLGDVLSKLEDIINGTSKLSDSQNGHGKVGSEAAKESSHLRQNDLEGLRAKLDHCREVNSFIRTSKNDKIVSQDAKFSNPAEGKHRSHLHLMQPLVDELTNEVSSQKLGAEKTDHSDESRPGAPSSLDDQLFQTTLPQNIDNILLVDELTNDKKINIYSAETFNAEIKRLKELKKDLQDSDKKIEKQEKAVNKRKSQRVNLESEEGQKQMFQDMLNQVSKVAKEILEDRDIEKQLRIYEHIKENPALSREKAWEYLADHYQTKHVMTGERAIEIFVAGIELYMEEHVIKKYEYLNNKENMLISIKNCIPKEYKRSYPIYGNSYYDEVNRERYQGKFSGEICDLIDEVEKRYIDGKVMLSSIQEELNTLNLQKESREKLKEELKEELNSVLKAVEVYQGEIYEHLCQEVRHHIDQQRDKIQPHFNACQEAVQTIEKALKLSRQECEALKKTRDERECIINENSVTWKERREAYKQMEEDIEKKLKDIGKNHSKDIGKNHSKDIGKNHSKDIGKNHSKDIGKNHSKDIGKNHSKDIIEKIRLKMKKYF